MPIATFAGTAGVVPKYSLNYSSQGGDGLLGLGWSIGGGSAITRCRQTLGQDKNPKPITFSSTDRFCLDGQRLLLTSGTYGSADSTYKTEIDSFAKVTAKGGTAGHPDYFVVERKDGSVSKYGGDSTLAGATNSEFKPATLSGGTATHVLTWALSEFKDSVGNPIYYRYDNNPLTGFRPLSVRYAYGNSLNASDVSGHKAAIRFRYENRPQPIISYVAGYQIKTTKRLKAVWSRSNDAYVRQYNLHYDEGTQNPTTDGLSRLTSIDDCAGGTCLPATKFTWSLPAPGFGSDSSGFTSFNTNISGNGWTTVDYKPGDFNGDGQMDLLWVETNRTSHRVRYAMGNGSGGFTAATFDGGGSYLTYNEDYGTDTGVAADNRRIFPEIIDFNADGRMDVAIYGKDGGNTRVYVSKPQIDKSWKLSSSGVSVGNARYRYADLDSDGLLDAYQLVSGNLKVKYLRPNDNAVSSSNTAVPQIPH